jgi:hypothetical protein
MTARNIRDCRSPTNRDKAKKTIPRSRREREVIQNHRGGGSVGRSVFGRNEAIGMREELTEEAVCDSSLVSWAFGSHATRRRSTESRRDYRV